jgi:hypothetical protein
MKTVLGIVSTLFLVASPFVLYWTLTHHDVAVAAFTLIAWVVVRTIPILMSARSEQRRAALQLPAIALTFLRSLRGTPLIEHFARMVKADLGVDEQAHCRRWTKVWGLYLLALALLGLGLARFATLEVWTIYVGFLNYVLVGVLFAVEYLVRKLTFRDYGRNPIDWLLGKMFPAPRPDVS